MWKLVKVCSWCKKIIGESMVPEGVNSIQFEGKATHGICPECAEHVRKAWAKVEAGSIWKAPTSEKDRFGRN